MEARKQDEIDFHDARERDRLSMTPEAYQARYSNKKWYSTTEHSHLFLDRWIASVAQGSTVLDYCCGLGGMSLRFAQAGATVYGIDISPESVATARDTVTAAGFGTQCHFDVMDAENLGFPDSVFDVIICAGVLHHLDVSRAFPELARVLKPSGSIVAGEALGYNPIINAYRKLTPTLRTSWEADHILTMSDLKIARTYFGEVDPHFFHLFSILATPLRTNRIFKPVLQCLNAVDDVVLRVPFVQLMAWQMIFFLREPKKRR
jgi:ubiquinone/menaquinone biosynthesis C-methylase UbiE